MPSDPRWAGGLANREWQTGNRVEQPVDGDAITRQVRQYRADCAKYQLPLSQRMCLKVVFHQGAAQEEAVVTAYRQQVSG